MERAAAGPTDQRGGHLRCAGDKGQHGDRVIMLAMRSGVDGRGVKLIFHWNGEDGKFDVVKVNTAERNQYETRAERNQYETHAER